MRSETTIPAPTATGILDWALSQPLAVALLLLFAGGVVFRRIVTIGELRERLAEADARYLAEKDRADKLQKIVDTQGAGLSNATDALRQFADAEKVSVSLMQGIDQALRNQRGDRR